MGMTNIGPAKTVTAEQYEERACFLCKGTGQTTDPTNADKVNAGPVTGACPRCKGNKVTLHLIPTPEIRAAQERETARARACWGEPLSDIPDWMC